MKWWIIKVKHPSSDIYRKNISLMKINNIIVVLHTGIILSKVKVGVLRPVQQPGSYWDRSSELPLVGLEPTEVTAYD